MTLQNNFFLHNSAHPSNALRISKLEISEPRKRPEEIPENFFVSLLFVFIYINYVLTKKSNTV